MAYNEKLAELELKKKKFMNKLYEDFEAEAEEKEEAPNAPAEIARAPAEERINFLCQPLRMGERIIY